MKIDKSTGLSCMSQIKSAELLRYNANSRGTSTTDCSVRAISLAFNKDYNDIKKLLNSAMKDTNCSKYNYSKNIIYVIKELLNAGPYTDIESERLTVGEFADQHASGTYVIGCSRKPEPRFSGVYLGGHIVTIINGKVIDTWDSRNYYVCKYWKINNSNTSIDSYLTDLSSALSEWAKNSKDWWNNEVKSAFGASVAKSRRLKEIVDKQGINVDLEISMRTCAYKSFVFSINLEFYYSIPEYDISDKYYKVIKIAVKPSTKIEDIESYIKSEFEVKLDGQVWSLVKLVEKAVNGYQESENLPEGNFGRYKDYMNDREKKIFSGLPYWVQKITNSFDIYGRNTGYWDNYSLEISVQPLPNDPDRDQYSTRTFSASSKDDLVYMLEHYRRTGDYYSARDLF